MKENENELYLETELIDMGFEWVNDGGEMYLQKVLNKEDYFNSPYLYAEEQTGDSQYEFKFYKIKHGTGNI